MGNHTAGYAMGRAAAAIVARRRQTDTAIGLLDEICRPCRNTDAEFESEDPSRQGCVHPEFDRYTDPHPEASLGMLMLEAFAPNGVADVDRYSPMFNCDHPGSDAATDAYFEDVYYLFKQRYGFW